MAGCPKELLFIFCSVVLVVIYFGIGSPDATGLNENKRIVDFDEVANNRVPLTNPYGSRAQSTPMLVPPDPKILKTKHLTEAEASTRQNLSTEPKVHIIFSTSCTLYQQWQSELFFFTHQRSKFPGSVTRLVSGCGAKPLSYDEMVHTIPGSQDVLEDLDRLNVSSNSKAFVHQSPELPDSRQQIYANKPYQVLEWIKTKPFADNDIVIIADPDQMIMNQIPFDHLPSVSSSFSRVNVQPGKPYAAKYEIGALWVHDWDNRWPNVTSLTETICGRGSLCTTISDRTASAQLQVGPPYIMYGSDLTKLGPLWLNYTVHLNKIANNEEMIAEMITYAMVSAHLGFHHSQSSSLMVSLPEAGEGSEAWDMDLPESISCDAPLTSVASEKLAPFWHYCQFYRAYDKNGKLWPFHKGHVPKNFLDCDIPLLKIPPDDLYNTQTDLLGKRNALAVCMLYSSLNEMAVAYKTSHCPKENPFPREKTIRIKNDWEPCVKADVCFEFAKIEDEDPAMGDGNRTALEEAAKRTPQ
eukprot:m.148706 g.148706  ORF g.148706 m.148706 type:complete len:525 (+) comp30614_c0_seq2:210-1784(+)